MFVVEHYTYFLRFDDVFTLFIILCFTKIYFRLLHSHDNLMTLYSSIRILQYKSFGGKVYYIFIYFFFNFVHIFRLL